MAVKVFKIILFSILVFFGKISISSEYADFSTIDTKTYNFYLKKNWDSLIVIGNLGIENNIDYFYLRYRLGVAYFNKENYIRASTHFEKALEFNESDNSTLEYLFYCYEYSGKSIEANILRKKHLSIFDDKKRNKFLNEISLDFAAFTSPSKDYLNEKLKNLRNVDWADINYTKNVLYYGGGLSYYIFRNILITNAYSTLKLENAKEIYIGNQILTDNYSIYQNQAYINADIELSKGLTIITAFHYLLIQYKTIFSGFDSSLKYVDISRDKITLKDYTASLSLNKRISDFTINLNGTYSNLNYSIQKQIGLNLTIFPLGNLNLYTISRVSAHNEQKKNNLIIEQKIGFKVAKHLWTEGFVTFGKLNNYVEQDALVVNNMVDVVNLRLGAIFTIPIKKTKLYFKYQYFNKSVNYGFYSDKNIHDKVEIKNQMFLISLSRSF